MTLSAVPVIDTGGRPEATACNNLAVACDGLGLADERFAALQRSAEVYEALADRRGAAIALINLADHQMKTDQFADALTSATRAIELAKETGAGELRAAAYVNAGDSARHLRDLPLADALLSTALDVAEEEELRQWSAEARLALARTALARDDFATAAIHYDFASAAFDEIGASCSAQDARLEREAVT